MALKTDSYTVHETSLTKSEVTAILCAAAGANSRNSTIEFFPNQDYTFAKVTQKVSFFAQAIGGQKQDSLREDNVNVTLAHLDTWGASQDHGNAMALRAAEIIRALLAKPAENA